MKTYHITIADSDKGVLSNVHIECKPELLAMRCLYLIQSINDEMTVELRDTDALADGTFRLDFHAWDVNDEHDVYASCKPVKNEYPIIINGSEDNDPAEDLVFYPPSKQAQEVMWEAIWQLTSEEWYPRQAYRDDKASERMKLH